MTATEERLSLSPRFVAQYRFQAIGYGYALGRAAQGDVRVQGNDAGDFGEFYADRHERDLDIDELFAEFIAQREEQRAAEEDGAA